MYVVDTNILLDVPNIVESREKEILIPLGVLKELDNLKKNKNPEIAFQARRAAIYISRNIDNLAFDDSNYDNLSVDDQVLAAAENIENSTLITNDVYLKIKAMLKKVPTQGLSKKSSYEGIQYFYISTDNNRYSEELEKIYEDGKIPDELKVTEGQYIIIKDRTSLIEIGKNCEYETLGIFKVDNGKLKFVEKKKFKNEWFDYIAARNDEQMCLIDSLLDQKKRIFSVNGVYGSGY